MAASLQKEVKLVLREPCSHVSAKVAMAIAYVFPSLALKAQSVVFLHFSSDLGHEKPRWRF